MMKRTKIILIPCIIVFLAGFAFCEADLYLFGRGNFVRASGSESDYKEGVNDFPIASSHQNYGLGLGFALNYGAGFIGLEIHYNLSGKATLTDPSDDDTVEIETYNNYSGYLVFGLNLMRRKAVDLFINSGIGVVYSPDAETKTYTSHLGYETEIDPPEKKSPFSGFGGIGLRLNLSSSTAVLFSGRYLYIALDEPQTMFVVIAGIVYRF